MDLNQATAEALKEVMETLKDSKVFVKEQAPALAKEILLEAKVAAVINLVLSTLFVVGALICLFTVDMSGSFSPTKLLAALVCAGGLIGFFCLMAGIYEMISLITAPKMFILKKLSEAVNRGK